MKGLVRTLALVGAMGLTAVVGSGCDELLNMLPKTESDSSSYDFGGCIEGGNGYALIPQTDGRLVKISCERIQRKLGYFPSSDK